jgi:glucose 1-dehydrogenase
MGGIDVMVCNAGVTRFDSIFDLSEEKIDQLYSLNYRAYLMCARYAAKDMRSRSAPGRIIFIASTRGIRAYPEDAVYGSLKAALIRSVKSLALELADCGISVNAVAPGATKVRGDLSDEWPDRWSPGRARSPWQDGFASGYRSCGGFSGFS